jgi:hypothetical protein
MSRLTNSLQAWGTDSFTGVLKKELQELGSGVLPLHEGVSQGGIVDDSNISASVLHVTENEESIAASVGVFFTEIVGGCSCGDDPMEANAYCEINVRIDKHCAEAVFSVIK